MSKAQRVGGGVSTERHRYAEAVEGRLSGNTQPDQLHLQAHGAFGPTAYRAIARPMHLLVLPYNTRYQALVPVY